MDNRQKKTETRLIIGLSAIVAVIILLAIAGFVLLSPPAETIQGQAEATEIRISGKLPGRIAEYRVSEGQYVHRGDTLVRISSPDAEARLQQASAMESLYKAENEKVDNGARAEVIQSAHDIWQQAVAARDIARKSYDRMEALFRKGVVSEQKRDEAKAQYEAMTAAANAAYAQYDMARKGAQKEDKEAASAMVRAAQSGVNEVKSILADSYLTTPIDGEISEIFPHVSELVGTGAPIMNVLQLDDIWVTFNVREELLDVLHMGEVIQAVIPALGNRVVALEIFYIKDMGDYAVWRATKATGGYDARTFQIKARPTEPIEYLRPGMSVLITPEQK
ncbi:MAG: efflux RND transporter periplasmic adaptor subunit [Coprobacter sp.]|nr:efflux RND transporter periplasmic adaptor subunit [Coprobacter sp.]